MLSNKISLVKKYIKLSKLRVVELLLVTTVPSMIVSLYSMPPLNLVAYTLIGGTLLAIRPINAAVGVVKKYKTIKPITPITME